LRESNDIERDRSLEAELLMSQPAVILVCFAVKEEGKPFVERARDWKHVRTLITGMGRKNAELSARRELSKLKPAAVFTSGFAGGLRADLKTGEVLFAVDENKELERLLISSGATPAKFYCAPKVAVTSEGKRTLAQNTRADAVEMESEVIRAVCTEQRIPSATVRVVLDTADEDLPLDFNALMTAEHQMRYGKLATTLLMKPGKVKVLIQFQKRCRLAAEKLADVLVKITEQPTWLR
jgi:adenosylhomocysteine nucleosidase